MSLLGVVATFVVLEAQGFEQQKQIGPPKTQPLKGEEINDRLARYKSLLIQVSWSAGHGLTDPKETDWKVLRSAKSLRKSGDGASPVDTDMFKEVFRAGLDSGCLAIKGLSAVCLGILKDEVSGKKILKMMRTSPNQGDFGKQMGCIALGLLGSQEFAEDLVTMLGESPIETRGYAALGLGYLGLVKHADIVAKLLESEYPLTAANAARALAEMGACGYAKCIASLLNRRWDDEVREAALYSLVRLSAFEHVHEAAQLLDDSSIAGTSAKAVSLLGGKEYTEKISHLLESSNPQKIEAALLSLGILGAREYAPVVLPYVKHDSPGVRDSAAWALALLNLESHRGLAQNILRESKRRGICVLDAEHFDPLVFDIVSETKMRALQNIGENSSR